MAWSVWVCDTVTGDKLQRLPVSAFSWSRVLNGSGSGSSTVQLTDKTVKLLDVHDLTDPVRRTLVLDWDGVVVYAGIIWGRTFTHPGTLTLTHSDIWSIISKRFAVDHTVSGVEMWSETYSGGSLRNFTRNLMGLGLNGFANSNMLLPITLPAAEAGTTTRTLYGYHLENLGSALEDVMNEGAGPDIDFRPRYLDGKLNWEMRVGSAASPKLVDGSYEWHLSAPKSGVFDFVEETDAQKLVTNMVAVGEGSEQDMLVRSERVINPTYPHLERALSYKQESNLTRLSALALGGLNAYKTPTTQWSFSVMASGTPAVSALLPGGVAKVWVGDDEWLAKGPHTHRLIEFSGDLSEKVKLQFQPGGL